MIGNIKETKVRNTHGARENQKRKKEEGFQGRISCGVKKSHYSQEVVMKNAVQYCSQKPNS